MQGQLGVNWGKPAPPHRGVMQVLVLVLVLVLVPEPTVEWTHNQGEQTLERGGAGSGAGHCHTVVAQVAIRRKV